VLQKTHDHISIPASLRVAAKDVREARRCLKAAAAKQALWDKKKKKLEEKLQKLQVEYEPKVEQLRASALGLARGVHEFAAANRDTLLPSEKKSLELPYQSGLIEFEFPSQDTLVVLDEEAGVRFLKRRGYKSCVRVTEKVDKNKTKELFEKKPKLLERTAIFALERDELFRIRPAQIAQRFQCKVGKAEDMEIVDPEKRARAEPKTAQ
jgi:phage host-nuclease inhibitor protein Gam